MPTKEEKEENILQSINEAIPDFLFVSNISILINYEALVKYIKNIDVEILRESNVEEDDILFTHLPLALMYENTEMTTFFWAIVKDSEYEIEHTTFEELVEKLNSHSTGQSEELEQFGGVKILSIFKSLGIIIVAAFYTYFIITNGSVDRIKYSYSKIIHVSNIIIQGCDIPYNPSSSVNLAARFTADPSLLYKIDYAAKCLSTPGLVLNNLKEQYAESRVTEVLTELQANLKELPGFPDLPELPAPEKMGTSLVPFENSQQVTTFIESKIIVYKSSDKSSDKHSDKEIDTRKTLERLKVLANIPSAEFKKLFEIDTNEPTSTNAPTPTNAPTWQQASSFVRDVVGTFKELAPNLSPSFSFDNMFLWLLQDSIKKAFRQVEDIRVEGERLIEDEITDASRIISDIKSLPYVIGLLIFLNINAIIAFIYLIKVFNGSQSGDLRVKSISEIKGRSYETPDVRPDPRLDARPDPRLGPRLGPRLDEGLDEGPVVRRKSPRLRRGGRKTMHKHKRRTHKHKYGGKRRQTKGKKGRRITRKH
jgi:hypothetical protein